MPCNISPLCKVSPPTDEEKGHGSGYAHLDPSQLFSGASNTRDTRSGPLFSIYSEVVSEEDNKLAERWQKDADGMLIFTGLFSAAVAAFLAVSFQDLRPDPQDTSVFYLRNIYLAFTESNTSSIPPNVVQPPVFSPSWRAIWVNLLWTLSLGISLTCAVMTTVLQQWARQYLKLTQARQLDPKKKARTRALFSGSTDKLLIKCLGYLLPCYLHLSVLFFFVGLLLFLFDINNKIFNATLWLFGFSIVVYAFFTILPFFMRDSLLFTPVSAFPVAILGFIICIITTTLGFRFNAKLSNLFERLFIYVERTGERPPPPDRLPELDTHILEATLGSLGEDDAVEKFFEAVPEFFSSNSSEPLPITPQLVEKFREVMNGLLDHTFQLTTVPESVKTSRLLICLNASRAVLGSKDTSEILSNVLNGKWPELLQSVEIGHSLRSWSSGSGEEYVQYVRSIVSRIITNTENHDDRWSTLVEDELGISKDLLRDYLVPTDNILLANFNNITRQIFRSHHLHWNVFSLLSKCDISRVLPSLQHDFCDLWNDIVREAQVRSGSIPVSILKDIRHVYIALHRDTIASPTTFSASTADDDAILNQPSSYPSCNIDVHRSHPPPDNHDEPVENVPPALATHSSAQAVPLRGDVSGAGTHPLDFPAHHTTSSPVDGPTSGIVTDAPQCATLVTSSPSSNLSASQPLPTPPPDVTAIDARPDVSSISSVANSNFHFIPGGVASQQNDSRSLVVPPSSVNGAVPRFGQPPHASGSLSSSTTTGRSHNIRDPKTLQPGDHQHHLNLS